MQSSPVVKNDKKTYETCSIVLFLSWTIDAYLNKFRDGFELTRAVRVAQWTERLLPTHPEIRGSNPNIGNFYFNSSFYQKGGINMLMGQEKVNSLLYLTGVIVS